jgi:hypothetical protein
VRGRPLAARHIVCVCNTLRIQPAPVNNRENTGTGKMRGRRPARRVGACCASATWVRFAKMRPADVGRPHRPQAAASARTRGLFEFGVADMSAIARDHALPIHDVKQRSLLRFRRAFPRPGWSFIRPHPRVSKRRLHYSTTRLLCSQQVNSICIRRGRKPKRSASGVPARWLALCTAASWPVAVVVHCSTRGRRKA